MEIVNLFDDKSRPLAVVTAATCWDEPPRFRHQVTRQLSRFYNVLYVERCSTSSSLNWFFSKHKVINNKIILYKSPRLPRFLNRIYAYVPFFHNLVDYFVKKNIEKIIRGLGYDVAALINFQFDFICSMKSQIYYPKIYLCNDEFPNQARLPWQRKIFNKYEQEVIRFSDCCVVHSAPLLEKFSKYHDRVYKLLPGHEFDLSEVTKKKYSLIRKYYRTAQWRISVAIDAQSSCWGFACGRYTSGKSDY